MNTIDEKIQIDLDVVIDEYNKSCDWIKYLVSETEILKAQELQSKRVDKIRELMRLLE